jgi:agarase
MAGADGFFRVEKRHERWWLIAPDGKPFISRGVDTVKREADHGRAALPRSYPQTVDRKYGSLGAWQEAAAKRLLDWNFNTLGCWSDEALARVEHGGRRLAYSGTLNIGAQFVARQSPDGRANAWLQGLFPDVFHPAFAETAREIALQQCAPVKDDPLLLGWFTDNELHWEPDWMEEYKDGMLSRYLKLPGGVPGRRAAVGMLQERYGEFAEFEAVWRTGRSCFEDLETGDAVAVPFPRHWESERPADPAQAARWDAFMEDSAGFLTQVADRYFRTCTEAVRAADPNHLIMGPRFAIVPAEPVVAMAGKYLDVISFNCYEFDPTNVIKQYEVFQRPLIIGEFSFRGQDSGLPNTRGAGPRVPDQRARADAFEDYVRVALGRPNVVGYHWFEHADQPKEGRADGENSNYGVVNIEDEVYVELTERMTQVNAEAEAIHAGRQRRRP